MAETAFDVITGAEDSGDPTDALATIEEVQTIASARQYSAAVDFSQDEVTFPKLRLAQGLTPEVQSGEARPGEWLLSGEAPAADATVVPLAFARLRQMREDDGRAIVCQSPDSTHGFGEYGVGSADNPTGLCAQCPMAAWTPNPRDKKRNLPPRCTQIYSYVCYSLTHRQIVALEFSRSSMTAAKLLNTLAQSRGFGQFAVRLTTQSQKGPKGTYYVPSISFVKSTAEDLEEARAVSPVS